jgi:ABC-2 type transport system permease protein/oleandomycin transport system permease protein
MSAIAGFPATTTTAIPKGSRLHWVLIDSWILAQRNLRRIPRMPEVLVFATVQPVLLVLLFRYVFGGAIDVGNVDYVNYLMAGIFVQTTVFGAMITGIGLADDLQKGLVDRFRSLPIAPSAVLIGRTVADLLRNVFVVCLMLAIGLLVGFRPHGDVAGWFAAVGLLLLMSFAFSWISATIGLLVRNVEAVQSAGFIWVFPLVFASSAFVATATMPHWLRVWADNQPMSQFIDAVRGFLLGNPDAAAAWQALAWGLGILAVFVPLAVRFYQRATTR